MKDIAYGFAFSFVLDKLRHSLIVDLRQQAYILATVRHESANTFMPVKEYGSMAYLTSKPYFPFIGRGFIQLTHKTNYEKFGKLLGVDLFNNMELACEPETAWKILELGMTRGLFTGKKLDDYFNDEITDYVNARKIVNGLDQCGLIAHYAEEYFLML